MGDLPVHVDVARSLQTFGRGEHEQSVHGVRTWKLAVDLARYADVIARTRPDVIVETGTKWGGSARWFETRGVDVVTVDIYPILARLARMICTRTMWIVGSSIDPDVVAQVRKVVDGRRVMVSLDSEHAAPHVAEEIRLYGPLVSPGCYLVVEDAIFDLADNDDEKANGGRMIPELGGPLKAIEETLAGNPDWQRDEDVEKMFPISHHPAGFWIRRG